MTVYTAIINGYDDLKEPAHYSMVEGWDCVCFTDQDIDLPENSVWRIVKIPLLSIGAVKTARRIKIMFWEYVQDEYSLWIDGTFAINCNLTQWWTSFKEPFTTIKHPFDDCIYKDARSCIELGKDKRSVIQNQVSCYRRLGVKRNAGLIASGILMRRNTHAVREICKTWWDQVESFSSRDQIAFGYAQHKHPNVHQSINWNYTKQREFYHIPHLNKKWRTSWQNVQQVGMNLPVAGQSKD